MLSKKSCLVSLYIPKELFDVLSEKRRSYSMSSFICNTLLESMETK